MKALIVFIRRSSRSQSIGLITIGLAMLAGANVAEHAVTGWAVREAVQLVVILAGITATAILFRRKNHDSHGS